MSNKTLPPPGTGGIWKTWRRPLLQLTCLLLGTMLFYRSLSDLFSYPENPEQLFLAPVFFGGLLGTVLCGAS